jgi:hypothetical protein
MRKNRCWQSSIGNSDLDIDIRVCVGWNGMAWMQHYMANSGEFLDVCEAIIATCVFICCSAVWSWEGINSAVHVVCTLWAEWSNEWRIMSLLHWFIHDKCTTDSIVTWGWFDSFDWCIRYLPDSCTAWLDSNGKTLCFKSSSFMHLIGRTHTLKIVFPKVFTWKCNIFFVLWG